VHVKVGGRRLVSGVVVIALVASCAALPSPSPVRSTATGLAVPTPRTSEPIRTPTSETSPSPVPSTATGSAVPTPGTSSEPTRAPTGGIAHATGPTDVVLRFEDASGESVSGGVFAPGPIFTLYGDGTVIFQNDLAKPPPVEGSVVRARPFMLARLNEDQVQSLLRFALQEGGLAAAREPSPGEVAAYYGTELGDDYTTAVRFTVHAGGLDKRVDVVAMDPSLAVSPENAGPDAAVQKAFAVLADYLRNFDRRAGIPADAWIPDRCWGILAGPGPRCDTAIAWPWPDIALADFVLPIELPLPEWYWPGGNENRRVMSAEEAAMLGLSDITGGVQGICLIGLDGLNYGFALWPLSPSGVN